jgi:hypothetical protein
MPDIPYGLQGTNGQRVHTVMCVCSLSRLRGEVRAASASPQRTATVISPIRSNASVITSPDLTGATPWQVPDIMMSPG